MAKIPFLVRLTPRELERVDAAAAAVNRSRANFIRTLLLENLSRFDAKAADDGEKSPYPSHPI